ncbi:hypothetical protein FSP39_004851 [Pinctada imbricata]|uniref:Saposin B-type domain-containing protein n=1 Tax=Pinctada imbricata TaxID=66713 RepID=A0AA88XSE0_PINIB|nr:hypothetical protein FSP39_004851 [Pinctada imbricata]
MERIFVVVLALFAVSHAAPRIDKDYLMCEVCHIAVEDMKNLIAENATQGNVESKLEDICNRLTADVDVCLNFVHSNIGKIFGTLTQKMDPEEVCILLDVCPKSERLVIKEPEEIIETHKETSNPKKVDNVVECEICKLLIVELDRYIKNNSSESAINKTVTEFCNKLPSALKTFCLTYEPKMVQALVSGLDPTKACAKVKLCSSEEYDDESERKPFVPSLGNVTLGCEICKLLITEVDSLLQQNKSVIAINTTLYKVCDALPASLKLFCTTYEPQILSTLSQGADPTKACQTIKLCSMDQSKSLKELMVPPLQDAKCEVCEFLVTTIDQFITKNTTKEQINSTVYSLCNILPDAIKATCELFAPQLVQKVEKGLDPEHACIDLKACPNTTDIYYEKEQLPTYIVKNQEEEEDKPAEGELEKLKDVQDTKCDVCEFVCNLIDQFIERNSSASKINSTVYSLCALLPDAVKVTCDLIAPTVVKSLENGLDPGKACAAVKLCPNASEIYYEEQEVPRKIVEKERVISHSLHFSVSQASISHSLHSFCQCTGNISFLTLLLSVSQEIVPEVDHSEDLQDTKCDVCQFLCNLIDQYIAKNSSEATINSTIYSLCNALPDAVKATCDLIAPTVVKDLAKGLDPVKTCTTVKLCSNTRLDIQHETKEVIPEEIIEDEERSETNGVQAGEFCELCEFVVQLVDSYLEKNASSDKINATIMGVCNVLPAELKLFCDEIAPKLVSALIAGIDPVKACTEINLCVNGSFEYMGSLPSLPCDMCIAAIEGGNPMQFNEEVAFRACSKICVEQQHQHIVKKRSVKKFTESIEKEAHVLGKKEHIGEDWECDVCVWLAEAANIFLKDNKTESSIANNLNSLCRFLPQPYDKVCKDTTPTIVKELEHGVDPKKLCIEIMGEDDCKNLTSKKLPSISQSLLDRVRLMGKMTASEECNLCKDVISAIRGDLDQSTESVKKYLEDTCNRMPEPTNEACSSLIDKEYEALFNKIIKKLLDPDSTCHILRVC